MSYQGSTLLLPIAEFFSLQIDQFNFITTQAVGVLAGLYYRTYLGPCKQNIARRLWYNAVLGIVFGFFCFGHQMLHLVLESIMCYLLLLYCPRKYVHL
jgi:lysophospholipid acyltransferase 1/2